MRMCKCVSMSINETERGGSVERGCEVGGGWGVHEHLLSSRVFIFA